MAKTHPPRSLTPLTSWLSPQPQVFSDTRPEVAGTYMARGADDVPAGFARVCSQHGWDDRRTWGELNGGEGGRWFQHEQHDGYIYHNKSDGEWWIDGPDGCVPLEQRVASAMTAEDGGVADHQMRHPTPTAGLLASHSHCDASYRLTSGELS